MRLAPLVLLSAIILAPAALAEDGQIDIAQLPFTITQPGSYVVVDNLTLTTPDTDGITIMCDNVTIDLAGHTLTGPGAAAGTLGSGINTDSAGNVAVFNGVVREFRLSGIRLNGLNNQVWHVRAYDNGYDGITIGNQGTISDCVSNSNGGYGIFGNWGAVVRDNSAASNVLDGIRLFDGSTATGNSCQLNSGHGIRAAHSLVAHNACSFNTGGNLTNTGLSVDNYAP